MRRHFDIHPRRVGLATLRRNELRRDAMRLELQKAAVILLGLAAIAGILFVPDEAVSRTNDYPFDPVPLHFVALVAPSQMSSGAPASDRPHEARRMSFAATVTGYSAEEGQTDADPSITANGSLVFEGGIACPSRFAFGTRVRIAGNEYLCNDRMAERFRSGDHFDIFFADTEAAIHFGTRTMTVQVLE